MDAASAKEARRRAAGYRREMERAKAGTPGWEHPTTEFQRFVRRAVLAMKARADAENRVAAMYEGRTENPEGATETACDGDHAAPDCGVGCWWNMSVQEIYPEANGA